MRVLVTGGFGVNGSWVVRELAGRGHEVVVLENRDDRSLLPDLADALGTTVPVEIGDVADAGLVAGVVARHRPDAIVHMAAVIAAGDDPVPGVGVNVSGTTAVCEAAVRAGVGRVVYTSSRCVYGALTGEHGHPRYVPVDEDQPRRPAGLYDVTKVCSEEIGGWYRRARGLEFVSLRFATIFGPGKLQRHGGFSTYSSMIELPAAGRPVRLPRGGDERDDVLYVADVATAIAAAALAPGRLPNDAYNIGHGTTVSLHELADAVRAAIPGADIEIGPGLDPMGMDASYYGALDSSRARADLGWSAEFTLSRAVPHYLDALDRFGPVAAPNEGR